MISATSRLRDTVIDCMRDRGRVRIDKSDKAVAARRRDVKMNTLTLKA